MSVLESIYSLSLLQSCSAPNYYVFMKVFFSAKWSYKRFQCCHCRVALSSTTAPWVSSASWNIIKRIRRASKDHQRMKEMHQHIRCASDTSTATHPADWLLKCKTACESAGKSEPLLGPAFLHEST